jgi:hypothetical protein
MAVHRETMISLLDRAMADPGFLSELARDPLGTAQAAGVELSAAELKSMLGMPGMTDAELVEVLRARFLQRSGVSCVGGDCDDCIPD